VPPSANRVKVHVFHGLSSESYAETGTAESDDFDSSQKDGRASSESAAVIII